MVFCSAVASLMLWMGCTRFNLSLNSSQGTMVLKSTVRSSLSLSVQRFVLLTVRWSYFSRNPLLPVWSAGISLLRRVPCWTRISTLPDCERNTRRVWSSTSGDSIVLRTCDDPLVWSNRSSSCIDQWDYRWRCESIRFRSGYANDHRSCSWSPAGFDTDPEECLTCTEGSFSGSFSAFDNISQSDPFASTPSRCSDDRSGPTSDAETPRRSNWKACSRQMEARWWSRVTRPKWSPASSRECVVSGEMLLLEPWRTFDYDLI